MQISSATYNTQASAKTLNGQESATPPLFDALISDSSSSDIEDADTTNPSATSLQSALASTALAKADPASAADTEYHGAMTNITKYFTDSDIQLIEKTTGATIENGQIIMKDGRDIGEAGLRFVMQLSGLRSSGTVPSLRDVTSADLKSLLNHYQSGTGIQSTSMLEKALDILTSTSSDTNATTLSALENAGFTDEEIHANKLANVNYTGAMEDITKYLTKSDIALYEKATGGTIKDGIITSSDTGSFRASLNLVIQLNNLRSSGAVPSSQDITAADLQAIVKNYQSGPGTYDTSILEKALDVLTSEKA